MVPIAAMSGAQLGLTDKGRAIKWLVVDPIIMHSNYRLYANYILDK